jgi:hypothetical protein
MTRPTRGDIHGMLVSRMLAPAGPRPPPTRRGPVAAGAGAGPARGGALTKSMCFSERDRLVRLASASFQTGIHMRELSLASSTMELRPSVSTWRAGRALARASVRPPLELAADQCRPEELRPSCSKGVRSPSWPSQHAQHGLVIAVYRSGTRGVCPK